MQTINNIIKKIIDTYFDMDNNLVFSNQYLDIKFETKNDNVINGDDDVEQLLLLSLLIHMINIIRMNIKFIIIFAEA